ncbi:MAG: hypothetical protein HC838_08790 [Spirulinaceae cyanobacterium RM2_2_10]|nr:hypothetical protein [Spirulinaceae cyanobacterium RM2_2_10]
MRAAIAAATERSVRLLPSSLALVGEPNAVYCPLTLELPSALQTPVSQACQDVTGLRRWVEDTLGYPSGRGDLWLPVVLTARGPLYAEAITRDVATDSYRQPFHLSDDRRQPLYRLAYELLAHLDAPPSVYLLQLARQESGLYFDRLWPFPTASAIASQGVQTPDLFACHWRCLTKEPILDLYIPGRYATAFP